MRKLTCSPDAEYVGLLTFVYIDNLMAEETAPVFERHGLTTLEPHTWYPLESFLEALNELGALPGMSQNMTAIGMKVGETVPVPPELGANPTLEEVLNTWNDAYQVLHRGTEVGKIWIEKVNDRHFKTFHTIPYPDDMSYGVLYGYGKRFLPPQTPFTVHYDDQEPARDYGGTTPYTVIHIEW